MVIVFDLDGTICRGGFSWVGRIKFPWYFILVCLMIVRPKPYEGVINFLNNLCLYHTVEIRSARHKELENYTRNYLKQHGALFYNNVRCISPSKDIAKRKTKEASKIKADIVIDNDPAVIEECMKYGISAYFPQTFFSYFREGWFN